MLLSIRNEFRTIPFRVITGFSNVRSIVFDYYRVFIEKSFGRPIVIFGAASFIGVAFGMNLDFFTGMITCILSSVLLICLSILYPEDTIFRCARAPEKRLDKTYLVQVSFVAIVIICYGFLYISIGRYRSDCFYLRRLQEGDYDQQYFGYITDAPVFPNLDGYDSYVFETDMGVKISFASSLEGLKCGEYTEIKGQLLRHKSASNPGCFDAKSYYASKGVYLKLSASDSDIRIIRERYKSPGLFTEISNPFDSVRMWIRNAWGDVFSEEEAAVISAMILGDKSELSNELKNRFRLSNLSHLIAVSGLHVGCFLGFISSFSRISSKRKLRLIFALVTLIAFGFLTGWTASVTRAVLMSSYGIVCSIIGKRADSITGLFGSSFLMMIIHPFYLSNIGFRLSFFATLSILLVSRRMADQLSAVFPLGISSSLATMTSAWIGMLPILMTLHSKQSLMLLVICLIGTLLSQWICLLTIPLTLLMIPLSLIIPGHEAVRYLFWPIRGLVQLLLSVTEIGSFENIRALRLQSVHPILLAGIVCLMISLIIGKSFLKKILICISVINMLTGSVIQTYAFVHRPIATVIFMDVGQGDGTLIVTESKSVLIDGGEKEMAERVLLPVMNYYGVVKTDITVMSHLHSDHGGGLLALSELGRVGRIGVSAWGEGKDYEELVKGYDIERDCYILGYNDRIQIEDEVEMLVLHPDEPTCEGGNEDSLVILLRVGETGVLFMGDAGFDTEERIMSNSEIYSIITNNTDIIKVGHHGSKYSSSGEFLNSLSPTIAVISVGTNFYGHPTQEAIDRLTEAKADVFRTDLDGAIIIDIYSNKSVIQTMLGEWRNK
ncbi:MAG: DNA internalization-related competence protein ComEC/Rec2 [Clostridiaceae bacterium]|nr:DNA internalization-related competence protein ComEC/Rec2 [Clostridiaceae bacterium]